jgi:Tfp pilus assembly protein PilO
MKLLTKLQKNKYSEEIIPYLKKEKSRQYLMVILTLTASIFFALFAINPTLSTIAKLRKEVEDYKFASEQLETKINNLSSLSQAYQNISGDIPTVLEAVPQDPGATELFAEVQALAQESNVTVTNIGLSPIGLHAKSSSKAASFSFSISGKGEYDGISTFLSNVSGMRRVVKVDKLSISKNEENTLILEVEGTAFYKE